MTLCETPFLRGFFLKLFFFEPPFLSFKVFFFLKLFSFFFFFFLKFSFFKVSFL
ncbi:hypothetical protein N408_06260 [Helicobacter pylori FD703]|nr:hypothetical protein N408_06260 [Helicobacter pylori FD703]